MIKLPKEGFGNLDIPDDIDKEKVVLSFMGAIAFAYLYTSM